MQNTQLYATGRRGIHTGLDSTKAICGFLSLRTFKCSYPDLYAIIELLYKQEYFRCEIRFGWAYLPKNLQKTQLGAVSQQNEKLLKLTKI